MTKRNVLSTAACACAILMAPAAMAGAHTWDVNEVFSNADGTIQFIELRETLGGAGEIFLNGLQVTSESTGNAFTFPANLVGPSSNRHLLLATQSFADLPGAPTPDHIIPAGMVPFFDLKGDSISYHVYDTFTFGAGQVPTDCVNSLNDGNVVALNSPTNYAGDTGSVDACPDEECVGDFDDGGNVNAADLAILLGAWSVPSNEPGCGGVEPCAADLNGDTLVNAADLALLLGNWGPCR